MTKTTKADLEKKITELEEQLTKYQQWLMDSEEKYNKLVNEKENQLELLPTYQQMKNHIERLEAMQKDNEYTITHKAEVEKKLRNKIQELLAENEQLRSIKNQTVINDSIYNARGAGRKPMPEEKLLLLDNLLKQGKKEQEICELMNISRATFYRVKKLCKNSNHK